MIKLCAFSDEYGNSLQEQIEGLQKNEIDLIELRTVDGKSVLDFTFEEAKSYKNQLDEAGVRVWSLGSPIGKVDVHCNFEEYLQKVRHVCQLAQVFDCKNIRMFSFFQAYDSRETVIDYLQRMAAIAEEYGVVLCHENEKDIYGDSVERVLDLYRSVKGYHWIFDAANYIQCYQDMQEAVDTLLDKTDYFHVKDVIKSTGELVPAGYGDGLYDQIVSRLNGDYVFTLEPHLMLFTGYSSIDGTEMKNKFHFNSNPEAFDFAVKSFKEVLLRNGYERVAKNTYQKGE